MNKHTDLFDGLPKRLLHVAPESEFARRFGSITNLDYFSASINGNGTRVKMDITAIPFPDDSFDAIYCSHVLEHVVDDTQAMREFRRVLKSGGWALLLVPITNQLKATFDDSSVTNPEDRERLFGQWDHVRSYGSDYPERLSEAGFIVEIIHGVDVVGTNRLERWGIDANEDVYFCRKPV
jgi:SAM-dependent methyltransferase